MYAELLWSPFFLIREGWRFWLQSFFIVEKGTIYKRGKIFKKKKENNEDWSARPHYVQWENIYFGGLGNAFNCAATFKNPWIKNGNSWKKHFQAFNWHNFPRPYFPIRQLRSIFFVTQKVKFEKVALLFAQHFQSIFALLFIHKKIQNANFTSRNAEANKIKSLFCWILFISVLRVGEIHFDLIISFS